MSSLRLLISALAVAAGPVLAGPFEDRVAAHGRQDYAATPSLLQPHAHGSDAMRSPESGAGFGGAFSCPG